MKKKEKKISLVEKLTIWSDQRIGQRHNDWIDMASKQLEEMKKQNKLFEELLRVLTPKKEGEEKDYLTIKKSAKKVNLTEGKASDLVDKIRNELPMNKKSLEEMIEEILNDRELTNRRQIVNGLLSLFTQLVQECVGEDENLVNERFKRIKAVARNELRFQIRQAFRERGIREK